MRKLSTAVRLKGPSILHLVRPWSDFPLRPLRDSRSCASLSELIPERPRLPEADVAAVTIESHSDGAGKSSELMAFRMEPIAFRAQLFPE